MKRALVFAVLLLAACDFGPPKAKLGEACGGAAETKCAAGDCYSPNSDKSGVCADECASQANCSGGQTCTLQFKVFDPDAGLGVTVCVGPKDGGP